MSTELQEVTMAVAAMNKVETGLENLRKEYGGVVYEVASPSGMESARLARRLIREPRFEVEKIRKAAKAPILALGKKLDAEAARITRELTLIEAPIDMQITKEEDRIAAEKQARIDAEVQRVRLIQERIAELRDAPAYIAASCSDIIVVKIADIENKIIDSSFGEFEQEATRAKAATIASLRGLHAAAVARELEDTRIAAERAELAKLRAAQEERDRIDAAKRADDERAAKQVRDADAARIADEQRQERDRIAAEDRRIADERAAIARDQEALRVANLPKPPAQAPVKDPSSDQIIEAVAEHFGVNSRTALRFISQIDWEMVSA